MTMVLTSADLHPSLEDPVMSSITFLNEVIGRYPDAVSFAPGAPNTVFIDNFNHEKYIREYLDYRRRQHPDAGRDDRRLLFEYGPARGLVGDLIAVAFGSDHGTEVPEQSVVVTVGAQEAMLLTLRALVREGESVAVTSPCFPGFLGAARLLGIPTVPVADTPTGPCLQQLETALAEARAGGSRVRALYVAADHANPAGNRMPLAARHALLDLADEHDLVLVEDNAYGFTADEDDVLPPLKALDRNGCVVHIGTFAKIGVPGLRVGFVIADQLIHDRDGLSCLLADKIADLKTMVTVNTPPLCQAVVGGLLLLHGTSLRELGRAKGDFYRRNLLYLLDALDRHLNPCPPGTSWERPTGGFFVRLTLPVPADLDLLQKSARDYGVLWTPMSAFHLDHDGDRIMRLSCSYLTPSQIDAGVRRLAAFLRDVCCDI